MVDFFCEGPSDLHIYALMVVRELLNVVVTAPVQSAISLLVFATFMVQQSLFKFVLTLNEVSCSI